MTAARVVRDDTPPVIRLPNTDLVEALRSRIAAEFRLRDGDPLTSSSLTRAIAEIMARTVLLEQRLVAAEGTVTRCGFCGGPIGGLPACCRWCGAENRP